MCVSVKNSANHGKSENLRSRAWKSPLLNLQADSNQNAPLLVDNFQFTGYDGISKFNELTNRLQQNQLPKTMLPATQKATRKQTKAHNTRFVLKTIYDEGPISRADIARVTRLTRATISSVVADLIESELVEEAGLGEIAIGKPPTLISLAKDARHVIGIDLGNSEFRGAVVNLQGDVRHHLKLPINNHDAQSALALVYHLIETLIATTNKPILGIGIGTPGLIDSDQGIVKQAVNLNWENLPLRQLLEDRFNVPVYVANDSNTAVMAEYIFGTAQNKNLIVVKAGHGIGAGLLLNGQLFYGDDFSAGEIGHIAIIPNGQTCSCGNVGCLETVASSRALIQQVKEVAAHNSEASLHQAVVNKQTITTDMIFDAFEAGDSTIVTIIEQIGRYLGMAIANLIGTLDTHHILIAGSLSRFGNTLLEPIQQEIQQRIFTPLAQQVHIKIDQLGPNIVILGAAALVLTHELGIV